MTSITETPKSKAGIVKMAAAVLLPLAIFTYFAGVVMNLSLNDPDMFWHIKTGEYIIDNWEVPDVDPFAYTTPRPLSESQKIGLRAQWLGQVFFALANKGWGLFGVQVLRSILILIPSLTLFIWLRAHRVGTFTSVAMIGVPLTFLALQLFYSFERPQGISFFLILVVVMLLDRVRGKCREGGGFDFSFWLLPLVMALWSNIHAGFILGNMVLLIYICSEALLWGYKRLRNTQTEVVRPVFFAVCALALAVTVLNPNTYKLFYSYSMGMFTMFVRDTTKAFSGQTGSWVKDVVLEFKPLYYFYLNLNYKWLTLYWGFTAILYAALFVKYWLRRSVDLAELLAVSFVVFFANYHARGLMFSLTVMPYYMAKTLVEVRLPEVRFRVLYKAIVASVLVVTMGFLTYTAKLTPSSYRPGITRHLISPWYPLRLINFMKENRIDPPMYNYYTWGGFLIWSIYPEYRVFIDGRAIDEMVTRTADEILKVERGWYSKLDAYGINFVVIPLIFRESGHIVPLAPALAEDEDWKLIFLETNGAIFVRDVPKNRELIYKFNMDKKKIYHAIIDIENILLTALPNNPVYSVSKGDALYALGKYKEARAIFERYPDEAVFRLRQMDKMGR